MNEFNRKLIEEFRANAGQVGGMFAGSDLVLLTTTGAKSGLPRTSPTLYFQEGDQLGVVASNGGADQHPAWYHNLRANPVGTAEIGAETFAFTATEIAEESERVRWYAKAVAHNKSFAEYEAGTSRRIPVLLLRRHP
ncbi:nitroreductase family deazaflavin-dependent oxidoreductase [Crossiella cryophila]|uniref:Deazaflavin-dependent oxidoreductase (Nitroreductase family) n=1 Tax=Crossiella cryophila TaxID=43355 RepID=A0A7W7FVC8_9PSEU|nr:nitroreductase family deazaflavin-dependent oxidoreductase [Crossiella cryophila]MBB4679162.1 deazaflavin-dependent oxidoreductase (nitroreductase family) [Crossiella cryophila]